MVRTNQDLTEDEVKEFVAGGYSVISVSFPIMTVLLTDGI